MLMKKKVWKFAQLRQLFILISVPLLLLPSVILLVNPVPINASKSNDKIKGWFYYLAAPWCFVKYNVHYISGSDIIKNELGDGLGGEKKVVGVYTNESQESEASCNTIIGNGYKLWGFKSLEELIVSAGFEYKDGKWMIPNDINNKIRVAIENKVGNNLSPDPNNYFSDEELYTIYYWSFVYACEIKDSSAEGGEKDKETASLTEKKNAESGEDGYTSYYRVINGVLKEKVAKRYHTKDDRYLSPGLESYVRCSDKTKPVKKFSELAKKLGKKPETVIAEEFEKALGEITPSDCLSIGSPSERKACKIGHIEICVIEAQKGVPSTITDKKEKDDKIKELFADCYSKKTGETKEKILAALSGVSPSSVTAEPEPSGSGGKEPKDKCAIDGIGWLICPVVTFLAQVSDTVKDNIDEYLVFNPSELTKRDDGSVYSYWATMRNYANVLFVIAFIIIIYSQISGMGLSTYGIKRMLPRLVVGALLVNVSFYLCAAMVDLSNAIGASAYNFISSGTSAGSGGASPSSSASGDAWWATTATTLLVGGAVLFFALGAFIAGLITVLMIALTTLLLLGVRQAIIIFAIIISPLAFVAWLLPNTESLFKKWWQTFKTMLFVYPIIGIVYGASTLASNIIRNQYGGTDGSSVAMQIVAAVLMFVPLLLVPKVLNAAMSIGNIAAITGGIVKGKAGGFLGGAAKAKVGKLGSRFGNYRKMKKERRNAQIRAGVYEGKHPIRRLRSGANRVFNQSRISGGYGDMRAAEGAKEAAHQDHERMEMAEARINNMKVGGAYLNQQQLMEAATTGKVGDTKLSSYEQRAAIKKAAAMGTSEDALKLAESSANPEMDTTVRKEIADALAQSGAGDRSPYLGGASLADIQAGRFNKDDAIKKAAAKGKITAESLSKADAYSAKQIAESLSRVAESDEYKNNMTAAAGENETVDAVRNAKAAARGLKNSDKLMANVKGNRALEAQIHNISKLGVNSQHPRTSSSAPPPPPPAPAPPPPPPPRP